MSLIRQVWLLVLGIIVAGCIGSVGVSLWTAKAYVETQVSLKNNDNAQSLALTLSQLTGDAALVELGVTAQFDTGYYRSIRLKAPDGRVLVERSANASAGSSPAWFARLVPIHPKPGVAQVSSGWTQLGVLEVISHTSYAHDDLWTGAIRTTVLMAALGLIAAACGWWAVSRLRRPLDAVVDQAQALSERRFLQMAVPRTPELRRVAQALNAMVERLRLLFAEQASQVETLRHEAHCDELTGLTHRRQFLAGFEAELGRESGATRGLLLLVRVLALADVNRRLGHAQTDTMLQGLARALSEPVAGVEPHSVGRLNGSDFALLNTSAVEAADWSQALMVRVQAVMSAHADVAVVASLVAAQRGDRVGQVMACADAALARAEVAGAFTMVSELMPSSSPSESGGEDAWRRQLDEALSRRRTRLVSFPVIDARRALIHFESPLRVQLKEGGEFEPAAHWMPFALRTQMMARVDEIAVLLALKAIAEDGAPRCVHVSRQSLRDACFLPRVRSRISAAGEAARQLWIEVSERVLFDDVDPFAEMARQLRPFGVRIGVEHAGVGITSAPGLLEVGLDYVKLSASVIIDVAQEPSRATLVRRTVALLKALSLSVYAEGVQNEADLEMLWQCRIDGVTGPAVRL
ncbi:diguanylate cyclase/phosphodiesterase [Sphaerotilus hippei]|uniref:Diguanylate cyclase/phosphodiesterase n=1 Tax=Sphaerotilus hippei TaxID=744406 RepID=A0A318H654_9BURK|nr:LapD/MoxY N-terminal periplasmic domain-containing protein [Sphaerotilus hippei]PXW94753.1 diguanylate cyclase/phosphodiesterase [Sphaerotilus hippei]